MLTFTVPVVLILIAFSRAQNDNSCPNLSTCGECIQQPECVWCLNPKDSAINCENKESSSCESQVIVNNISSIIKDNPLSSDINSNGPFAQIRPQEIKLRIPNNQEHTIKFKFTRTQNPLDLYFLMDASFTMKTYKDVISDLGYELIKEISKHTTDYKLGFGTFVDKTVSPFDYQENQKPECKDCIRGYSFYNHLNLTTDVNNFKKQVSNAKISSNIDAPEGGLEALMQVIACTEEIGWRKDATHIVVFTTDDYSHIAGDGRLGGAVFPNDGKCHMTANSYTEDKKFDYPSVSHISYKAEENDTHIIFAIAKSKSKSQVYSDKVQRAYKEMSYNIKLSKYATLSSDGEEIIRLIVDTYKDILQSVKMSHNFDEKFNVKFEVKCPDSSKFEEKDYCKNVKVGKEIEFKAIIKPMDCNGSGEKYKIKPDGIDESLTIDLQVICTCDCETNNSSKNPDRDCHNHGYKICGKCSCDEGFSGNNCECSDTNFDKSDTACQDPNTNLTCNDHGNCKCGVCNCVGSYYGTFCLCEDVSCPRYDRQLCSGEDHGNCKCGKCECLSGWEGVDCSCSTSNRQCIAPYSDGKPCSGKGDCNCGKCDCEDGYFGDFCEGCTGCEWCEDLDPCVEAYLTDLDLSEAKSHRINCSSVNIIPRENATAGFYDSDWSKCLLSGKLGCNTVYRYKIDDKQVSIEIGEEICPFITSIGGLLLVILLPILLGGIIAFLAWKCIVTAQDNREYANFIKKRDLENWGTVKSPLYKEPKTTYVNPAYKTKDL